MVTINIRLGVLGHKDSWCFNALAVIRCDSHVLVGANCSPHIQTRAEKSEEKALSIMEQLITSPGKFVKYFNSKVPGAYYVSKVIKDKENRQKLQEHLVRTHLIGKELSEL